MRKLPVLALVIAIAIAIATIGVPRANASHLAAIHLGQAAGFAVLADTAVTSTGPTTIDGDVGLSPETGAAITGLISSQVTGTIYAVDAAGPAGSVGDPAHLTDATNAQDAAFADANALAGATLVVGGELGGKLLTHGVYKDDGAPASLAITGTLTLDAADDPSAVWIFQSASTLTTAAGSRVVLLNGAQACNVFWQLDSSATLGANSVFKGTILAAVTITSGSGADIEGRLLAGEGAVTLDDNTITVPTCAAPTPAPATATPIATAAPTATPTPTPAPTATPTVTPVPTPTPAVTPVPTATPSATPAPTATSIATAAPTRIPAATPAPSATTRPTAAPRISSPATTPLPIGAVIAPETAPMPVAAVTPPEAATIPPTGADTPSEAPAPHAITTVIWRLPSTSTAP